MRGALAGTSDKLKGCNPFSQHCPEQEGIRRFLPGSVYHDFQAYTFVISMTLRKNGKKDGGEIWTPDCACIAQSHTFWPLYHTILKTITYTAVRTRNLFLEVEHQGGEQRAWKKKMPTVAKTKRTPCKRHARSSETRAALDLDNYSRPISVLVIFFSSRARWLRTCTNNILENNNTAT